MVSPRNESSRLCNDSEKEETASNQPVASMSRRKPARNALQWCPSRINSLTSFGKRLSPRTGSVHESHERTIRQRSTTQGKPSVQTPLRQNPSSQEERG